MKLKNIFMSLLAVLFVATACEEEKLPQLSELQVSQSIIGFDAENPQPVKVTFTATGSWEIVATAKEFPTWFTVEPMKGGEGETVVTFTAAGPDKVAHEADLNVNCLDEEKHVLNVQHLIVKQGVQSKEITPLNTIATEGVEGATYYVHATIKAIKNGKYGNLLLEDESGTLDVYGTLNEDGKEGHFADLGLGVGDEIWAHGPFSPYKGTPQLKNITVDKYKKSLVLLEEGMGKFDLEKEAQDIEVKLSVYGEGLDIKPVTNVEGKEVDCNWISVTSMNVSGKNGVVKLHIGSNSDVKPRSAKVYFTSKKGKDASVVFSNISQKGNIPAKSTVKDAMISPYVYVEGTVAAAGTAGYVLSDATGSIMIYYKDAEYKDVKKVGDKVKVVGKTSTYNFTRQITDPDLDEKIGDDKDFKQPAVKVLASAEMSAIMAKLVDKDKVKDLLVDIEYVKVTGKLDYGNRFQNIFIDGFKDGDASIYKIDHKGMGAELKKLNGKNVDIFGYLVQVSGGKHFNVIVTSFAESTGEVAP